MSIPVFKNEYDTWHIELLKSRPPACYECKYRIYDGKSICNCPRTDTKIYNVITGEWVEQHNTLCQEQRYNEGPFNCGISGKFFKQKDK